MSGDALTSSQSIYLNGVRGLSAQLVVIGHIYAICHPGSTLGLGDIGVIIFFALSGFLIAFSAVNKMQKAHYDFQQYIRDRAFRIFVPYIPALFICLILDSFVFNFTTVIQYEDKYSLKDFVGNVFMLQQNPLGLLLDKGFNLSEWRISTFGSARPFWTVAIEWWLYVFFGLILFSKKFKSCGLKYYSCLVFAAIVPLFNTVAGTGQGLSILWFLSACLGILYYSVDYRSIFKLNSWFRGQFVYTVFAFCFLVFLGAVRVVWISYIEPGFEFSRIKFYDLNFLIILFGLICLGFFAVAHRNISHLEKVFIFLSSYSYSLYLIHFSFLFFFSAFGILTRDLFSMTINYIVVNLLAICFFYCFERWHKNIQIKYESGLTWRKG